MNTRRVFPVPLILTLAILAMTLTEPSSAQEPTKTAVGVSCNTGHYWNAPCHGDADCDRVWREHLCKYHNDCGDGTTSASGSASMDIYKFFSIHYEFAGRQPVLAEASGKLVTAPQIGFAFGVHTPFTGTGFQFGFEFGYRTIDIKEFNDSFDLKKVNSFLLILGARYIPMDLSLNLGNTIAVRPTVSASLGALIAFSASEFGFEPRISAGLLFSGPVNPSGLIAEVVYRPSSFTNEAIDQTYDSLGKVFTQGVNSYTIQPSWVIRIGVLFGRQ